MNEHQGECGFQIRKELGCNIYILRFGVPMSICTVAFDVVPMHCFPFLVDSLWRYVQCFAGFLVMLVCTLHIAQGQKTKGHIRDHTDGFN
jgi:hypothetical protein